MPQESLRSVVYRSFVTCDDPRGVIEGKTIRISKSDSTKMGSRRIEHETQSKNLKEKEKISSSCKRSTNTSSYQLVEVKNGAQKLNQVINSWSKGISFEGQSKDIAKDLLKGALDLQESLLMLGKLQETTQYMTKFKKKQQKPNDNLVSGFGSNRFENCRNYDLGFQKHKNLANGSPKDCYEELRIAIKDGLARQNLLPNKCYEESVSSSRSSSMVYSSHGFTSSESFSSRATEEKPKGSNLIAKLMGLDEFPSKILNSSPKTRPVFDIDLPNAKKTQVFVQKLDREQMTLDEIIEAMQSKGLLRKTKQTSGPYLDQRFKDDEPPIVLMKPHVDNRKVKENTNSIRKLHQEKAKAEEKAVKNKQKTSVPVVTKPQRKQETEKKIENVQKIAPPVRRKALAKDSLKSTNSISKTASSKQVKPQRSVLQNPPLKRTSSSNSLITKSSNQKRNLKIEKPVHEPLPIVHEVLQIDARNDEETKDSEFTIKEIDNGRQQEDSYCVNDAITSVDRSETNNNHDENGVSGANEQKARILESIVNFQHSDSVDFELFRDCVNEFWEHENLRRIPTVHPLLQTSILTSRFCVSEDRLMREITNEVENLRNYSKISNESCHPGTVYGLLERDLCWSTNGAAWGTGWKDGCTLDEVEEVVLDLEKMVLTKFIDDVLIELVP